MNKKKVQGIIGITDEGRPIVVADYQCVYFSRQSECLTGVQECWYCKYADFRKTCDINLRQSVCRCPKNQMNVVSGGKNEMLPSPLIEKFVSNIKGGVITCIYDEKTGSSKAVYINEGWTEITGYTLEALEREVGGNPQALVYPADKQSAEAKYTEQLKRGSEYTLLYRVIRKDGNTIWVIDRGVVSVMPNGEIQNQSIVTEVTEIKEQEERLQRLAQLDLLTSLYNKVTFIQQARIILARQHEKLHALIVLDVDDFKKVNDSMGHAYGDKVLESVGDCLKTLFRNRDVLGRGGGDEFVILMTDIPDRATLERKAADICETMHSIKIDGGRRFVSVSVGVAVSEEGKSYEQLFEQADAAMYRAKNDGKDRYAFFDDCP
ncbi:MAG: diguanylate cyclase [Oscillospiraceae bacterium]